MNSQNPTSATRARRIYSVKWLEYDADVIPAWVADTDLGIPPSVKVALDDVIAREEVGYPPYSLTLEYLAAFSEWQKSNHGVDMDPSFMMALSDVIQGFNLAISTLVAKDSGVVFFTPSYPPFFSAVEGNNRRLLTSDLVAGDNGYEIDFDDLEEKFVAAGPGGALLLCNPHNPTGRVFSHSELTAIAELALRNQIWVISDEIHADLCYSGFTHIPFVSLSDEIASRTVTLSSASKSFNLAGLHCAVLHAGDSQIRKTLKAIPEGLLGHPSSLGLLGGAISFREGRQWLDSTLETLRSNREAVMNWVASTNGLVRAFSPEATYLAWLDFTESPRTPTAQRFVLDKAAVALNPGESFATWAGQFARLNFGTTPEVLEMILSRIDGALRS